VKIENLDKLLEDQLKDLYSAENQLIKALPKMAKAASTEELKEAITTHLEETRGHAERLTEIGEAMGISLTGKKCAAMEGLIEEGKESMEADGPEPILDLALIAAAQRVEHYEIAAYGTARAIAEHLGHSEVVDLLQQTLDEEAAADKKLTDISTDVIFPEASQAASENKEDADEESPIARKSNSHNSRSKSNGRRSIARTSHR
jgi:ferritin-like metal-binding protein YciE